MFSSGRRPRLKKWASFNKLTNDKKRTPRPYVFQSMISVVVVESFSPLSAQLKISLFRETRAVARPSVELD